MRWLVLLCVVSLFLVARPADGFAPLTEYRGLFWRFLDAIQDGQQSRYGASMYSSGNGVDPAASSPFGMRTVRDSNSTGALRSAFATATSYLNDHLSRRKTQDDSFTPGFCSDYEGAVYIKVLTVDDIARRLNYPRTRTVILEVNKNLVLDKGLLFDGRYSCTVLRSNNLTGSGYKISYFGSDQPVLRIWNTSNVLVLGLSFSLGVRTSSPECVGIPENGIGVNCPTIHVYRSYGIQIAKGTVFGRIDLFRSMSSRVDSMRVTGVPVFNKSPGVIRVAMSGHGPTLQKSYIAITNNEVYGVDTPIVLYQGAIGVIVRNNYVHDFIFAGIRCGADVHYAADCVLSTISYNIVVAAGTNRSGDQDAAGIYYCTHWFSPANYAECNYVFNGDHCYYLDYVTSGVTVNGGACVGTYDGIKVNNGKWNSVDNIIIKDVPGVPGWCTCFTPTVNHCGKRPGTYWEAMRKRYYDTPLFRQQWPWWDSVCQDRSIRGKLCNIGRRGTLQGKQTGYCSGLPTDNFVRLIVANGTRDMGYKYCEVLPTVEEGTFNKHQLVNLTDIPSAAFFDYAQNDFGVYKRSSLFKTLPNFKSCPRWTIGPRRVDENFYLMNYNHPEPPAFQLVATMATTHIIDRALQASLK
ncbi:hypothetical protein CLOM_g1583 [Closterium sp. NIES-68]|nr:hypothetical protein CLOM_g1583 [Closterium sp. NIES-68]GJP58342.1 hypothetical protein CLOP_g23266 [Closterium sp. NIES-67]GJP82389.1 hypothetical protein CLOP_g12655 [Closterium sp. NIES-67]